MKNNIGLRGYILVTFFALQMAGIIAGRFTETKFFCWAPYDQISTYDISVSINGVQLNEQSIFERYQRPQTGRENRSIYNLLSIISQYETTYGQNDNASVVVTYTINGHRNEIWVWPDAVTIPKN